MSRTRGTGANFASSWLDDAHAYVYPSVRLSRMRLFQRFGKHQANASHMHHTGQL